MVQISIIIPVYNTSQFLPRCIESCLAQNIPADQYEIIAIDDGSTDDSLAVLRSYENTRENIKVYAQKNQKQGAARNNGLKKANGEYIWFVDSDDWVEPNVLGDILEQLSENAPDLLRFDAKDHFENKTHKKRPCAHLPNTIYKKHEVLLENKFSVCVPFYIFKKNFLWRNDLKFLEHIFYEDSEFMPRVIEKTEIFQYWPRKLYNVLKRSESTTRTANYKRKLDLLVVIGSLLKHLKQNRFENKVARIFHKQIAINVNYLLYGVAPSQSVFKEARARLKKMEGLHGSLKKSTYKRHQFQYWLLVKHPEVLRKLLNRYYH